MCTIGGDGHKSPTNVSNATHCDPFNTHTLSILPDGTIGSCDRTFGRGMFPRSLNSNPCGRYEALRQTECSGCPRWNICGAGCPEEGIGGDWRRKTRWCETTKKIYSYIEGQLVKAGKIQSIAPTTSQLRGDKLTYSIPDVELKNTNAYPMNSPHGDSTHGDEVHGDSTHGDVPHGDMPHGDSAHADDADYLRKGGS